LVNRPPAKIMTSCARTHDGLMTASRREGGGRKSPIELYPAVPAPRGLQLCDRATANAPCRPP
jgi:hypothetical protein